MNIIMLIAGILLLALLAACVGLVYRKHALKSEIRNMANTANQPGVGTVDGHKTFLATAASDFATFAAAYTNEYQPPGRFAVVKLGAAGYVAVSASATDIPIGIAQDAPDAVGDPINVRLLNSQGSCRMVAAATITLGNYVQSNGDGAVKTAVSTGYIIGRALQAAGAAGDIIEVMLMSPGAAVA